MQGASLGGRGKKPELQSTLTGPTSLQRPLPGRALGFASPLLMVTRRRQQQKLEESKPDRFPARILSPFCLVLESEDLCFCPGSALAPWQRHSPGAWVGCTLPGDPGVSDAGESAPRSQGLEGSKEAAGKLSWHIERGFSRDTG